MRASGINKDYILDFLMKSSSLKDLLGILSNICENLNLDYLNPRIKHFRYFQFTFFGLLVKAKSLLEMMSFRAEFLKNNISGFEKMYYKLVKLKKSMGQAYSLVHESKMQEGKNKIIEVNKEYSAISEDIKEMLKKVI